MFRQGDLESGHFFYENGRKSQHERSKTSFFHDIGLLQPYIHGILPVGNNQRFHDNQGIFGEIGVRQK